MVPEDDDGDHDSFGEIERLRGDIRRQKVTHARQHQGGEPPAHVRVPSRRQVRSRRFVFFYSVFFQVPRVRQQQRTEPRERRLRRGRRVAPVGSIRSLKKPSRPSGPPRSVLRAAHAPPHPRQRRGTGAEVEHRVSPSADPRRRGALAVHVPVPVRVPALLGEKLRRGQRLRRRLRYAPRVPPVQGVVIFARVHPTLVRVDDKHGDGLQVTHRGIERREYLAVDKVNRVLHRTRRLDLVRAPPLVLVVVVVVAVVVRGRDVAPRVRRRLVIRRLRGVRNGGLDRAQVVGARVDHVVVELDADLQRPAGAHGARAEVSE
mmetsp:Transcript_10158/g.41072  ORF Transcript_10158/g.41072 Transcript_10158/m.41072 type:complete len:318 (+) Transcript_10158:1528-2481(+)